MKHTGDARKSPRCPVAVDGEIRLFNGVRVEGTTKDLSLAGVRMSCTHFLPVGHEVQLSLVLHGERGDCRIEASGVVSRVDSHGVAIHFESVDTEAFERLQDLIRFNAPDPDRVDGELAAHAGSQAR